MKIPPPPKLLQAMERTGALLVTSHTHPDGDALGSVLGTCAIWNRRGRRALGWMRDPGPPSYRSFPGVEELWTGETPPPGFPEAFEAVLVLECPTLERTGLEGSLVELPIWNVDHHLGNSGYGLLSWIDPGAPAVAAMLEWAFSELGWELGDCGASCLLAGLVSDTGGFRFSNTSPEAFEAAARLLRRGARIEEVTAWLYENRSVGALRLQRAALDSLQLACGGRIATSVLTLDDFSRSGAEPGDAEGLVEMLRSIAGTAAAALLKEEGPGAWKLSLRSRGQVDVQRLAARRGGGGHRNAAGCRIAGTSVEVRERVVEELAEALRAESETEIRA